jgi:ATP-binding cassette subfamily B protein
MSNLKLIFSYLKPHKKHLVIGILSLVLVDGLMMIIPQIERHVIDSLKLPGFASSDLLKFSLLIVVIALVMAVLRFLWRWFIIGTSYKIERGIRNSFNDHLHRLSASFFQNHKTGNLMAYATNDLRAIQRVMGSGIVIIADTTVMLIATLALMTNIDWQLTLYVIIPLPFVTLMMLFFGKRIHRLFKRIQYTFAKLSERVQENISGIRIIKSFAAEDRYEKTVSEDAQELVAHNMKLVKIFGIFYPGMTAIIGISLLLTLWLGGSRTILNYISIGEFVAFSSYLTMLIWPMIAMGWIVNLYQRGTASLNRIQEILKTPPEIFDGPEVNHSIKKLEGNIEVQNMSFAYPDSETLVLNDISFSISKGETLAIVGRTGEGKSTIVKLLTRTFNPPKNTIFFDGNEIYTIPLAVLRENIAVVIQDIFLFSATVEENVRFGYWDASRDDIIRATRISQFYNDIKEFDKGFDAVVGERGVSLSGGQKQRLAIARAIVKNAPILILDDAFSSVDSETENIILKQLIKWQKGKTTIIIAHRISTMQHADKIIVLDKGKIVEQGNHKTLLKKGGIYKNIYEKQKLKEEIENQ